jgi:hypothetical protein
MRQNNGLTSDIRDFSKPDYLKVPISNVDITGNRQMLSKFNGWVTVDEELSISRKNAPEVAK